MKKGVFKNSAFSAIRSGFAPLVFTLVIIAMIMYGLNQAESSNRSVGLRVLEESVRRAAVLCYAIEGSYPDSISYIEEKYGVYIDRDRYAVHYDSFASNIPPDITVLELK